MDAEHHICVLLAPQDHKKFHVLKGVVEEWSPVLTAALLHHASSSTDDCKTVILENFALEVIECFVRFLYHGTLDDSPPPELLWELALMGKSYDVPNLQDQCFAWLEYYAFVLSHLQKMVRKVALDAETQRKNTLKRHGRYGENAAGVLVTTLLCSSWQHRLWACFFGDPPADSPLPFWIKYVTATSPTA